FLSADIGNRRTSVTPSYRFGISESATFVSGGGAAMSAGGAGGGGGGGYYGGGGGGAGSQSTSGGGGGGGGGGGSSFVERSATHVKDVQGVASGNGQVVVSW
ncbi:MAG: hypothetical protein WBV40_09420, partial [Candidatus Cybelea sp.]